MPYEADINNNTQQGICLFKRFLIEQGRRLPQPERCSESLYDLMYRCWNANIAKRPRFVDIIDELNETNLRKDKKDKDNEDNQLDLFNHDRIESFEDLKNQCIHEHKQGRYSRMLLNINDHEPVIKSDSVKTNVEDIFGPFVENIDSLTADDLLLNPVAPQHIQYLWSTKHRPCKSRALKKVHNGYDWNHYYKKHYDTDHLPSTLIQGYKFHIFYQNLNDKTTTPLYNLTICEDTPHFSILRFHAESPYEDTAFPII
ncbi:unnamed protein product, partial [Rotaria sp. Silwood1]